MQKVLFILGPTAVGKSDMAIFLAQKLGGEIISADSVQVYKGFDIGSAKIKTDEMEGVPHHLIDICSPSDDFSVAEFVKLTEEKINEIASRGKLPIIVGGTFLYVKALTEGYNFGGTHKHEDFREKMQKEIEGKGAQVVWQKLKALSPKIAEGIHPNNTKRLIRGLEIATFGEDQNKGEIKYDCKLFALSLDREKLYCKINKRVDIMLEKGLVSEVEGLLKQGVAKSCQSMQAIGYKEVVAFLEKGISFEEMSQLIKQHSRNYAKRQLTFLRSLNNVENIDVEDFESSKQELLQKSKRWLNDNN